MNTKMVRYILAKMLGVEAILLLFPMIVGLIYGETKELVSFLVPIAILVLVYLIFGIKKPEESMFYGKEGMVIVSSAWILWSFFGALPFYVSGYIPNYIDAFFETVSGFTTTGATILRNVEVLPNCMHFWRSLTQWIGGMGVLLFVLVLTGLDRKNTMHLMRAELPGPEKDKLVPKMTDTARILYGIYLGMTAIEVVLLLLGGMNFFDSLIHSFATAGTGGFSNYADSIGHFNSVYIESVVSIFMILFGVNFNLYYLFFLKDHKMVWKNEELRTYGFIILLSVGMITINISSQYENILQAFRYAFFQVAALITSTGYVTVNYDIWPMFSKCVLISIMIIGACASSTGGGIKISRFLIILKSIKREIKQMAHPKSVNIIRVNDKKMSSDVIKNVYIYLLSYVVIFAASVLLIALDNKDFATTFSAVTSTLNIVGPGISEIGPLGSYADFSALSKIVLCLDMLAGRLEIFPFLMLFSTWSWRKSF